jgi:G3E family GTPase
MENSLRFSERTRIPVIIVTGFLGSGKTTLLQKLLSSPELRNTAVLINEFGEIGLDHHLIEKTEENIVTLINGCICCTIREDLSVAIKDLVKRREKHQIPYFDRLVVETTGLADPIPIIHTLTTEPGVMEHFEVTTVITTIDAINGISTLSNYPEAEKQAALADHIVITKEDLVDAATLGVVTTRIEVLNPSATTLVLPSMRIEPKVFLDSTEHNFSNNLSSIRSWINHEAFENTKEITDIKANGQRLGVSHTKEITSFCLTFEKNMNWTAFGVWMTMLLHSRGQDILRVKGLIHADNMEGPVVFHGVQHIVYPPIHLDQWPDNDKRSRIVFIVRGISQEDIETSLLAFTLSAKTMRLDRGSLSRADVSISSGIQIAGRPFLRRGAPSWMR